MNVVLLVLRIVEHFSVILFSDQFSLIRIGRCEVIKDTDYDKVSLLRFPFLLIYNVWIVRSILESGSVFFYQWLA
jgi:hypothetical protein